MKIRSRGFAGVAASLMGISLLTAPAANAIQFNTFWPSLAWCNNHLLAVGATHTHYCEEIGIGTLAVVKENGGGFRGGRFSEEPIAL